MIRIELIMTALAVLNAVLAEGGGGMSRFPTLSTSRRGPGGTSRQARRASLPKLKPSAHNRHICLRYVHVLDPLSAPGTARVRAEALDSPGARRPIGAICKQGAARIAPSSIFVTAARRGLLPRDLQARRRPCRKPSSRSPSARLNRAGVWTKATAPATDESPVELTASPAP